MNSLTNQKNLKKFFYSKTDKLRARLWAWKKFGTNKKDYFAWLAEKLYTLKQKRAKFLDIGCGTGLLLKAVKKKYRYSEIYGLDLSPAMILVAKKYVSKKNIILGDATKLPFADNYFDAVSAIHMLYHVQNINKAIKEMKRVTKPNGLVIVTTSDYRLNEGLNKIHYTALNELRFPKFTKNKKDYLRFTPNHALKLMKKHFSKVVPIKYRNDSVYKKTAPCLKYYQSAMMYRNTLGYTDKRINSNEWEILAKKVENMISEHINKYGKLRNPGIISGFIGIK